MDIDTLIMIAASYMEDDEWDEFVNLVQDPQLLVAAARVLLLVDNLWAKGKISAPVAQAYYTSTGLSAVSKEKLRTKFLQNEYLGERSGRGGAEETLVAAEPKLVC